MNGDEINRVIANVVGVHRDYYGSLDAMHEAEKVLNTMQYGAFLKLLQIVSGCGGHSISWRNERVVVSATAAQRAEAFVANVKSSGR